MTVQLQLRRGTNVETAAFTGAEGELTYDMTNKNLRIHDGTTLGGITIDKAADVVHKAGTETVTGTKTLQDCPPKIKITTIPNFTEVSSTQVITDMTFIANNGNELVRVGQRRETNGDQVAELVAQNQVTGTLCKGFIKAVVDQSGNASIRFDTDATTNQSNAKITNSTTETTIPTMGWVNNPNTSTNVVHRSGNETIAGVKTFSSTIQGTANRALYADLAEQYQTDQIYPIGTLIKFGGKKDITIADTNCNGVISEKPGYLLDYKLEDSQPVALVGKTPIRVLGKINKFDRIVLSTTPGIGKAQTTSDETSIAIALESSDIEEEKLVLCVTKFNLF